MCHHAVRHWLADFLQKKLEQLAVFGGTDRLNGCAEDFDAVAVEDPAVGQLDREVQAGLSAEPSQECIRPLTLDHELDELGGEWLHVGAVRNTGVSHDGGW